MILTKLRHACFLIEKNNQTLIIDPGVWTTNLPKPTNLVAIVITHQHSDHFDKDKIDQLLQLNPEAKVGSHSEIADKFAPNHAIEIKPGDSIQVANFNLEFFGGKHANMRPDVPPIDNIGVLINNSLYYPGDSFELPSKLVKVLAAPAAAPWLKYYESEDFVTAVNADLVFPTHDAILSPEGQGLIDSKLRAVAKQYLRLESPIEIDG